MMEMDPGLRRDDEDGSPLSWGCHSSLVTRPSGQGPGLVTRLHDTPHPLLHHDGYGGADHAADHDVADVVDVQDNAGSGDADAKRPQKGREARVERRAHDGNAQAGGGVTAGEGVPEEFHVPGKGLPGDDAALDGKGWTWTSGKDLDDVGGDAGDGNAAEQQQVVARVLTLRAPECNGCEGGVAEYPVRLTRMIEHVAERAHPRRCVGVHPLRDGGINPPNGAGDDHKQWYDPAQNRQRTHLHTW